MEKIKSAFKALPEVNKIWKTKDGHFHLHPHNGGQEIAREDVEDETGDGEKVLNSKQAIVRINSAIDEAEVAAFLIGEERKSVIEAGAKKIASFK
jgi:hypothetical protein